MNNFNKVLVVVLAVQVVLAVLIFKPDSKSKASGEALLSDFAADSVTQIKIQDDTDSEIILKNVTGDWVLPDYGDYPVTASKVDALLDKFQGLKTDRLITQSETSQRRLKVADDEFVRRIEITTSDESYVLYVGNTVSSNAVHVRLGSEDTVYLVNGLQTYDVRTQPSNWIDTTYFSVPFSDIVSVTLENAQGTFAFTKDGDTWTITSPTGDRVADTTKISTFVNSVSQLRMQEPIGKEADESYGLDTPSATITIQVQAPLPEVDDSATDEATPEATPEPVEPEITTYVVQFGTEQDDGYVVKSSDSDYYVKFSTSTATTLVGKTLDDFLVAVEPTATPSLDVPTEPTAVPTDEPTVAPTEITTEASTVESTELPTMETTVAATNAPEDN